MNRMCCLVLFFTAFSCLAYFFPCLPLVVCCGVWYTLVSRNVRASVVLLSVRFWYVVEIQKGSTMKAVATALVLIAGAAVVLWYGNTLNSWVLGGLIGGLAALLLSIPISLTVFSYFSRRHDEQLRAEAQEEMALAQVYDYPQVPAHLAREAYTVDEEAYRLSIEEEQWREGERYRQIQAARNLPVPSFPRSLVA